MLSYMLAQVVKGNLHAAKFWPQAAQKEKEVCHYI